MLPNFKKPAGKPQPKAGNPMQARLQSAVAGIKGAPPMPMKPGQC